MRSSAYRSESGESMKYILTLDQGTTSSRAAIVDEKQNIVHILNREFPQIYPEEGWEALCFVPYSFIKKYSPEITKTMKANFYKIGNASARKHYSSWSEMALEMPDFHRPEFFSEIIFSDETV